ncbi:MAG TPA: DNA polymerase III subunit delta [Sphingomonas sp.]
MAAKDAAIARALDKADPAIRCYLLYGPDESASRALAQRLAAAMGPEAERIDLDSSQIASDPALLTDEAASISMFGGARHIRVEGVTDSCLAAVEALLEAPAAGNPVVLIAGALRKDAKLVKLVTGHHAAMAHASWEPDAADIDQVAIELGRAQGLRIGRDVARRLSASAGGDRAVLASEIEKLVLYADASPEQPRDAEHAMLDAIGADMGEADLTRFTDAILGGDEAVLDSEVARLAQEGRDGVGLVRSLLPQLLQLAAIRTEIDRGASPAQAVERAGRAIFWKRKDKMAAYAARWTSARIARAIERISDVGREIMRASGPGSIAVEAELFTIARQAARRR